MRPHVQEGYLLGEYPDLAGYDQKQNYKFFEIDFGRRLVAKFRFKVRPFWKDRNFPMVSREALYPDSNDPIFKLAKDLKTSLK